VDIDNADVTDSVMLDGTPVDIGEVLYEWWPSLGITILVVNVSAIVEPVDEDNNN